MIPKIIHYCWFGKKEKSADIKKYINSWKKFCPDYQFIEWNEENFDTNENMYCHEAYEKKQWAFVSDYVRLKVLYEYGGFYLDTDVEIVKSLESLRTYDAVVGYETDQTLQTAVIGASKKNDWIAELLKLYNQRHFLKTDGRLDKTTNVKLITNFTQQRYKLCFNGEKLRFGENMIVLPFEYLCAKYYETGEVVRTPNTYTIHHFNASWRSEKHRYQISLQRRLTNKFPLIVSQKIAKYVTKIKFNRFIKRKN